MNINCYLDNFNFFSKFKYIKDAPTVKPLNNKVFQNRGERVIFDMYVYSNPKARIEWFKNETKLFESNNFNGKKLKFFIK